jgi:heat shock protein HslJ
MRMPRLTLPVLLAVGLAACADPTPIGGGIDLGGTWQLVSGTSGGSEIPLVDGHRITLVVEGGEAGGVSACNHYFATLTLDGGTVSLTGIGGTEMACMPEEVMESEAAYLRALGLITTAARDGELLVLTGPETELRYVPLLPVPTADLVGTVWTLETLIEGETASSVMGEPATLELGEDGTLSGSTGCRDLTGRYEVTGDEVIVTEMTAIGDCPDGLAAQDTLVVTVIGDGFTVEVEGDVLTISSRGGLGLGYRAP